jgi:hypothetical protein
MISFLIIIKIKKILPWFEYLIHSYTTGIWQYFLNCKKQFFLMKIKIFTLKLFKILSSFYNLFASAFLSSLYDHFFFQLKIPLN